jgi:hypothetical protein
LARSALRGRFQSAQKPSADGRPARRMNSASRGLRPTVGLRRPKNIHLRRRRPTPGAERLEGPISIGTKAFGRRSACAPNEFGLEGPSADGRPVPTGRGFFASAEADAWRGAPLKADFNRRAFGRRSACAPRPSADGRVGLCRPGGGSLRRRRPTPGAERLEGSISIGTKAFGRRSACAPNEFGLQGPSASGRPVPTEKRSLRRRRPTPGAQRPGRPISIGVKRPTRGAEHAEGIRPWSDAFVCSCLYLWTARRDR